MRSLDRDWAQSVNNFDASGNKENGKRLLNTVEMEKGKKNYRICCLKLRGTLSIIHLKNQCGRYSGLSAAFTRLKAVQFCFPCRCLGELTLETPSQVMTIS